MDNNICNHILAKVNVLHTCRLSFSFEVNNGKTTMPCMCFKLQTLRVQAELAQQHFLANELEYTQFNCHLY